MWADNVIPLFSRSFYWWLAFPLPGMEGQSDFVVFISTFYIQTIKHGYFTMDLLVSISTNVTYIYSCLLLIFGYVNATYLIPGQGLLVQVIQIYLSIFIILFLIYRMIMVKVLSISTPILWYTKFLTFLKLPLL